MLKRTWTFGFLAVLLVSVGTILVCELIIAVFLPQRMVVPSQEYSGGINIPKANVSGRDMVPGAYDTKFNISSQRFRGQKLYSQIAQKKRIVVIGDSFAFGVGANDHESYPRVLETALKDVEVINAGIRGSGTGTQALWYRDHVKRFNPEIIVLTIFANDVDDTHTNQIFSTDTQRFEPRSQQELINRAKNIGIAKKITKWIPGYDFLAQYSHLLNFLRVGTAQLIKRSKQHGDAAVPNKGPSVEVKFGYFRKVLSWFIDETEKTKSKLLMVFVPFRNYVYSDSSKFYESEPAIQKFLIEEIATLAAKRAVPFADSSKWLKSEARLSDRELYYQTDIHLTPAGYQTLAKGVAGILTKLDSEIEFFKTAYVPLINQKD